MNKYMQIAYKEALKAYKKNEVPVGAAIVKNGKVLAKSRNNRQKNHFILGHAEINCILKAENKVKDWRLDDCILYVTLEPCEMCSVIIKESRIKEVKYLLTKNGEINIDIDCPELSLNYKNILKNFFANLR